MVKIKSKNLWNKAVKQFGDPKTPEDWEEVTAIYRKMGGKITVKKSERLYEVMNMHEEGLLGDLKDFLAKWISNPIVIGIAAYFLSKQVKKYIKK